MPQIGNTTLYPKQIPTINDYLIGTDGDVNNKRTHNYAIQDILALFLANSDIEGIDQNNLVVEKNLGALGDEDTLWDVVNGLPQFQVTEKQLFVFKFSQRKFVGGDTPSSGDPVLTLITFTYYFKAGKGYYGIEDTEITTELDESDFLFITKEEVDLPAPGGVEPQVYFIPNVAGDTALIAINTSGTYAVIDGQDVYFNISNVNGAGGYIIYRFIGDAGTYGVSATQVIGSNLLTLEEMGLQSTATTNIRFLQTVPLYVSPSTTKAAVVNALPSFTVTKNDIYVFNFIEVITSENIYLQKGSYFLMRGKGVYGVGSSSLPIQDSEFLLNFKEKSNATSSPKEVVYYNFDKSAEEDIVDAINASETAVVINDAFTNVVEKDGVQYAFIGANGNYGFGLLQADSGDIEELVAEDYNAEELIAQLLAQENTFAEKTTFAKMIKLTSQASLPTAESGMVINHNNELRFYNGSGWYTIDLTPYGV